jgi:hypothetical protein
MAPDAKDPLAREDLAVVPRDVAGPASFPVGTPGCWSGWPPAARVPSPEGACGGPDCHLTVIALITVLPPAL